MSVCVFVPDYTGDVDHVCIEGSRGRDVGFDVFDGGTNADIGTGTGGFGASHGLPCSPSGDFTGEGVEDFDAGVC